MKRSSRLAGLRPIHSIGGGHCEQDERDFTAAVQSYRSALPSLRLGADLSSYY